MFRFFDKLFISTDASLRGQFFLGYFSKSGEISRKEVEGIKREGETFEVFKNKERLLLNIKFKTFD